MENTRTLTLKLGVGEDIKKDMWSQDDKEMVSMMGENVKLE